MSEQTQTVQTHKRHWSFVVCDPKYLYPFAIVVLSLGIGAAFYLNDATHVNRVGSLVIGVGVWMSMRFTLREGINRKKSGLKDSPTLPGTGQLNVAYFNEIAFSIGDAHLQLHGFVLVIAGSILGSYGDLILTSIFPAVFTAMVI